MYKYLNPFRRLIWQRGIKAYGELGLFLNLHFTW